MKTTVLERLLITERVPRKADLSSGVGFAVPALGERPLDLECEPLLVTNMRGTFVPTSISKVRQVARYGMTECFPEQEGTLLSALWGVLWLTSVEKGWSNRCKNIAEAVGCMRAQGIEPRSLVVSFELLEAASGQALTKEEAETLMTAQGYITATDGVQVLMADFLVGQALVVASPSLAGFYTRADDRLGVMLTRANKAFFLVDGSLA